MKKIFIFLLIVMVFTIQASAQWTMRSWLGWYNGIIISEVSSFTFTNHQTGFSYAEGHLGSPMAGNALDRNLTTDFGFTWRNMPTYSTIGMAPWIYEINSFHDTVFITIDEFPYGITHLYSNDNGITWDHYQIVLGEYIDFYSKNSKVIYCLFVDYFSHQSTLFRRVNADTITLATGLAGFKEICFPDTVTGYARSSFTSGGYLEKTIDGGRNWTSILNTGSLDRINFPSPNTGYLSIGRTLYRTLDGGNTVDTLSTPNLGAINYINCLNDSTIYCACNSGQLIYSFDYGNSWILEVVTESDVNLEKVVVLEDGIAYVSDSDQYLHANDGLVESVKDVDKPSLNIYPNPATSEVYIPNTGIEIDYILMLNSQGQHLQTFQGNQRKINIEEMPKGIYILVAVSKEIKYYCKIVKI